MAIDPQTFEYEDTRWMDIYKCLQRHGFDVYSPAQKEGECTKPYVVVKNDGGYKHLNVSSFILVMTKLSLGAFMLEYNNYL